jgi:hypothetical protein
MMPGKLHKQYRVASSEYRVMPFFSVLGTRHSVLSYAILLCRMGDARGWPLSWHHRSRPFVIAHMEGGMVEEATTAIRIHDADVDALVEHMRRAGRPFTLDELVEVLQELWRRRRANR